MLITIVINDTIRVNYLYKKRRPFPRVYPENSIGLCQIQRQIRHTMSNGVYVDIDLVNAHPDILNQLFKNKYPIMRMIERNISFFYVIILENLE